MTFFREFTVPLRMLFVGNLMMLVTIVFYIIWWIASRGDIADTGSGFIIKLVFVTGVLAVMFLFVGINSLQAAGKGLPVIYFLAGGVVFFITLLTVTTVAFHREVTSELLLITSWAALEAAVVAVLQSSGRFGKGEALALAAALSVATGTGVVCYILHYRLAEADRFRNGLIPLIADEAVLSIVLLMMALNRAKVH